MIFTIEIPSGLIKNENTTANKAIKLFKQTNWKEFEKLLSKKNHKTISSNKNLSNAEIDEHIEEMSTVINGMMNKIVPTCEPKDSIIKYVNPIIK